MGWLGRVVVMFIGAGRVVVVLIGTSQSLSLRYASRACCVYNIDPIWPPSLRHSIGLSLSHWFDVGSSALCLCELPGSCGRVLNCRVAWVGWIALSWCRLEQVDISIDRLVHSCPAYFAFVSDCLQPGACKTDLLHVCCNDRAKISRIRFF